LGKTISLILFAYILFSALDFINIEGRRKNESVVPDTKNKKEEKELEDSVLGEEKIFRLILRSARDLSAKEALQLARLIQEECSNYEKIDPLLILAIIEVESRFSPRAVSPKGAIGLMQITPETMQLVVQQAGILTNTPGSLFDPLINLSVGINYLALLLKRFENIELALLAYNYGPTRSLKIMQRKTTFPVYVRKVLELREKFKMNHLGDKL